MKIFFRMCSYLVMNYVMVPAETIKLLDRVFFLINFLIWGALAMPPPTVTRTLG